MPSGKFVADGDVAQLGNLNMNALDDAGFQTVSLFARENTHADDAPLLSVFKPPRRVFHVASFLAEDGAEKALLGRQFGLAFRRYFPDKDVVLLHLGADTDDSFFVKVFELHLADIGNVGGRYFGTKFCITDVNFKFLNMNGGEYFVPDKTFGNDDGVFIVCAAPRKERDGDILTERKLSSHRGGGVGKNLLLFYFVAD